MGAKAKKILAITGLTILAIIAIGLGMRAFFNYTNGKKLERHLAELKASGRLVDVSKLASPCPDIDNGALLWKAAEYLFRLEKGDKGPLALISDISNWKSFSPEDEIQLKALVERNRRVIQLMLEASAKPCFRYGDLQKPVLERELPNLSLMIQATKLLIVDALFKAEAGQVNEAIDEMLKGLAFARLTGHEPLLISFLPSMANARLIIYNLNRLVAEAKVPVSVPALSRIMESLDSEAWRKAMVRAFKAEYAGFCFENYIQAIKGEVPPGFYSGRGERFIYWLRRPLIKSEVIWVSEKYQEMIEAAVLPFYKNEKAQIMANQEIKIPSRYKLAGLLLPQLYAVMAKEATLEAMIEAARAGLACQIYQRQQGKYPASISDLIPNILKEEPLDPFTGKSLIYRTKENGFIVYSLGTNRKDDGGKMSPMIRAIMEKDDDWSWRQNW